MRIHFRFSSSSKLKRKEKLSNAVDDAAVSFFFHTIRDSRIYICKDDNIVSNANFINTRSRYPESRVQKKKFVHVVCWISECVCSFSKWIYFSIFHHRSRNVFLSLSRMIRVCRMNEQTPFTACLEKLDAGSDGGKKWKSIILRKKVFNGRTWFQCKINFYSTKHHLNRFKREKWEKRQKYIRRFNRWK